MDRKSAAPESGRLKKAAGSFPGSFKSSRAFQQMSLCRSNADKKKTPENCYLISNQLRIFTFYIRRMLLRMHYQLWWCGCVILSPHSQRRLFSWLRRHRVNQKIPSWWPRPYLPSPARTPRVYHRACRKKVTSETGGLFLFQAVGQIWQNK